MCVWKKSVNLGNMRISYFVLHRLEASGYVYLKIIGEENATESVHFVSKLSG